MRRRRGTKMRHHKGATGSHEDRHNRREQVGDASARGESSERGGAPAILLLDDLREIHAIRQAMPRHLR